MTSDKVKMLLMLLTLARAAESQVATGNGIEIVLQELANLAYNSLYQGGSEEISFPLVPFGVESGDTLIPREDDGSGDPVSLNTVPFPYFGTNETVIYVSCSTSNAISHLSLCLQVNTNGILSFRNSFLDHEPQDFGVMSSEVVLVAPYWDDVDTSSGAGNISHRLVEGQEFPQLQEIIESTFTEVRGFRIRLLFVATYDRVPPFSIPSTLVSHA